jgi:hypothetical protein
MQVIVYGKKDCGKCEAAKDKLNRMGFQYEVRELQYYTTLHDGWRTDGSVALLAASEDMNGTLPILDVGGELLDYPTAMKKLKAVRHQEGAVRAPEAEPVFA